MYMYTYATLRAPAVFLAKKRLVAKCLIRYIACCFEPSIAVIPSSRASLRRSPAPSSLQRIEEITKGPSCCAAVVLIG